jgi:hypothetical protein
MQVGGLNLRLPGGILGTAKFIWFKTNIHNKSAI